MTNLETALKAETKLVVRNFQGYTSNQRADHAASSRLGYQQRKAVGEFFYTHPAVPGVAFATRKQAALAALRA
jgi:hypothetical protein